MRLFRVISNNEKNNLINNKSIVSNRKTELDRNCILFPVKEICEYGKYFYFTLEDCLNYAHHIYSRYSIDSHILEINIDEKEIYKHLAFGRYFYADYNEKGVVEMQMFHPIVEVILPPEMVEEQIKNKEYNLTSLSQDKMRQFHMVDERDRPKYFVNMGKTLSGFIFNRRNMNYEYEQMTKSNDCIDESLYKLLGIKGDNSNDDSQVHWRYKYYKQYKAEYEKFKALLPKVYEEFLENHKNYNSNLLTDFVM